MVSKQNRRGKVVLVIDFSYAKADGRKARYRRDASVQTMAAARVEATARRLGATLFGDPEIMCGPNGVPLRAAVGGAPEPPREPTFRAAFDRYLAEYAPSAMSPSTLDGYKSKLRARVLPHVGHLPVSAAFEVQRSRELDVALVAAGASISTRRNVLLGLRSVARFAVEAKILPAMPKFLPLPRRGKRVPSAPPAEDVEALLAAASCPEHRLVFLLAVDAGLRKGELRALRCVDADVDNDRLVVRLSRYRDHTRSTKSGHERQVPLTRRLRQALIEARVQERRPEEMVALNVHGQPWGQQGIYAALQRTLQRLQLPRVRLHALRTYFVTALLNGNVPVHVVRELAGHEDLATTQDYAAIVPADRGAAIGVLDRAHRQQPAAPRADTRRNRPQARQRWRRAKQSRLLCQRLTEWARGRHAEQRRAA